MIKEGIKKMLNNVIVRFFVGILSNIIQTFSPKLWKFIEKKFFNPYDFWPNTLSYHENIFKKLESIFTKYNIEVKNKGILELWPGWFLWVWSHLKKYWINKYYVLDTVNHFENVDNLVLELYSKINPTLLKNWKLNKDYFNILLYTKDWKIPLNDNSIDITFSHYVYEHVKNPLDSLKEISRITKSWWYWVHEIQYWDHIFNWNSLFYRTIPTFIYSFLFKNSGWWVNLKTHFFYREAFKQLWFEIIDEIVVNKYDEKNIQKYKNLLNKYDYDDLKVEKWLFIVRKK